MNMNIDGRNMTCWNAEHPINTRYQVPFAHTVTRLASTIPATSTVTKMSGAKAGTFGEVI
jgi:hypothetical protein